MRRSFLAILSLVALGSFSLAVPGAAAAAKPSPGYVELQGWEVYDLPIDEPAHLHLYGVTYLQNVPNITSWRVIFTVDFNSASPDPGPFAASLGKTQYPRNPAASFQVPQTIPLDATTVTITATLQHLNRKGVVDQTLDPISGSAAIVPVDRWTTENARLFCVDPGGTSCPPAP